ncbi:MAG TPA: L-arabinose isomerase, partial [Oscillospiraceae bacterium]|nr:L-arabinose isomerase [Oscillospiraceae bacterium]
MSMKNYEFWFVVGSQDLYGEETLKKVAEHAKIMADAFDKAPEIPCKVVYKPTVLTPNSIERTVIEANYDE